MCVDFIHKLPISANEHTLVHTVCLNEWHEWCWEVSCTYVSVPDKHYYNLLYYFHVACRLCLFKGNWLFVFDIFT